MPGPKLAAGQRRNLEQRVASLAAKVADLKADGDASKLAERLEDVGNRFLDLSDWLILADRTSLRVDDAGVAGGGGGTV